MWDWERAEYCFFIIVWRGDSLFYVMLAGMDLTLYTGLFYNWQRSSCLCLKSAWVRGVGHCAPSKVHMGTVCLPGDSGSQTMRIGTSGRHAPAVGSCHAGAGNQTAVFWKSREASSLINGPSRVHEYFCYLRVSPFLSPSFCVCVSVCSCVCAYVCGQRYTANGDQKLSEALKLELWDA